jgi:caspase domain-containing protein
MSTEEYSEESFEGPAYALVIGISKYKYGQDAGLELGDKEFRNLKFAAKDAQDFAGFLSKYGFIKYNVTSLLDGDAELNRIKDELDKLREYCKQSSNPLIIVYFSGHGWVDPAQRHYLVPHDAEKNRLRSTAFSNKEFSDYLNELSTNRLVVFLDACHAGAIEMAGAKGELLYDVHKDLGYGEGRYLIASCDAGQKSYEWEDKQNGIFTRHLIDLLDCKENVFDEEEIDIFNLYPVLRDKVKATAFQFNHAEQTPISENKGKGIVLAINQRIRESRIRNDEVARDEKINFLDAICIGIEKSDCVQAVMLSERMRIYVEENQRDKGYERFYKCFEDYLSLPGEERISRVEECVGRLIRIHQKIIETPRRSIKESPLLAGIRAQVESSDARGQSETPPTPENVEATEPPKALDDYKNTAEKIVAGTGASKTINTPSSQVSSPQSRRKLSQEDQEYILADIRTHRYLGEWAKLSSRLRQPISEKEFNDLVFGIITDKADDETIDEFKKIAARFAERWPAAEEVKTTKASSLMMR